MNGSGKITSVHRGRLAVIYLRQSSMAQVREHTESTTRQYGLVEEAVQLGWARLDVLVIDTDLGVSGRWGVIRAGIHRVGAAGVLRRGRGDLRDRDLAAGPLQRRGGAVDGVRGDHRDAADRRRWCLRSGRCQRSDAARLEGNDGRGGAACDGAAAAGQQAGRGRARRAAHPVAGRVCPRRARRGDRRPRRRGPGRDLATCSPPSPRAVRPTGWSPRSPIGGSRCAPTAAPGRGNCVGVH